MTRRLLPIVTLAFIVAGCGERDLSTSNVPAGPAATGSPVTNPRERLAQRLAHALRDPAVRSALKRKLDNSHAPEGKLQFQALARADQGVLLAGLVRDGGSVRDVLAELDAARGLEIYLPVPSHRRDWNGDEHVLVATVAGDADTPIAFSPDGERLALDPAHPPETPVLALVPQEIDFTNGRPILTATCWDICGGDEGYGGSSGSSGSGGSSSPASVAGLYLTSSHIEDEFESWLKGNPEYEYHVYGVDATGNAEQLACTGEHAGGGFVFDQNVRDWTGTAMLLSEQDRAAYEARAPGKPVRIVAFEDDDEACVPRLDRDRLANAIKAIDAAYKAYTSGKVEPLLFRGIKAAPSVFNLVKAIYSLITTGDDFVGNAVETSVAGWMPGGVNWSLKTDGTRTTGWFATEYRR